MEVVRSVSSHWTWKSHLIKLPPNSNLAWIDDCWDGRGKLLVYNSTTSSLHWQFWGFCSKDIAVSLEWVSAIPYTSQSPRWLHEQQDLKNHCSSQWVTPPQQDLSEPQPYQLHTNLVRQYLRDGHCSSLCWRDHSRHLSLQSQGLGRSESSQRLTVSWWTPRLLQGPLASPLPSSPCSTVRFQLHLNSQETQGSRKCFIMETWRGTQKQTYLLALTHMPKPLLLQKKSALSINRQRLSYLVLHANMGQDMQE